MNIVLDTNCLIISIAPKSPYRKVWDAFLRGDYNLCVSNEIIEEYSEVLSRNISPQVSEAIVYAILSRPNVIRKDPHFSFGLIEADKDDNKFVIWRNGYRFLCDPPAWWMVGFMLVTL